MPIDSNSLQKKLDSLSNWLQLHETQRILQMLKEVREANQRIILNEVPEDRRQELAREQLIGENRGLSFIERVTVNEIIDIESQLHPQQDEQPNQGDIDATGTND